MKKDADAAFQRAMLEARRSRRRDLWVGVATALILAVFFVVAFISLKKEVMGRGVHGRITSMEIIPQAETQISIGSSGLHMRKTDAIYRLYVTDPVRNREFIVDVDHYTYQRQRVGGSYYFVPEPKVASKSIAD